MLSSQDLKQIRTIVEDVLEEKLEVRLKPIQKDLKKLQKIVEEDFNFHDKNYLDHEKRLRRLETRNPISIN